MILVSFSAVEVRRLVQALNLACDYQDSLEIAYRTDLTRNKNGTYDWTLPREHRALSRRLFRDMKAFRRLTEKLLSKMSQEDRA